ncbi:FMN-dependent NADH-azoreductase [Staphylospora marina]|uniref:FMN-dependent NADH-azoreductase n=1 Tax=Staphylospora marina TaxID=2490858 RepID=UPI000F5C26FF|nr:FMN-dependent NADH-azoreductase [Staphylospora marina]
MGTLLYVTANPKDERESISLQVGRAFLNAYELANPLDDVVELDLYREDIPLLDHDVFSGWNKMVTGVPMTREERRKLVRINELADQFASADKYVFVTPMWNFGLPPMFKAYIDNVCLAGKAYKNTEYGPIGLLVGKRAVHIQARGRTYSHGAARAMDYADSYVRLILGFMGITDVRSVIAEGTLDPENVGRALQQALQEAKKVAVEFARS